MILTNMILAIFITAINGTVWFIIGYMQGRYEKNNAPNSYTSSAGFDESDYSKFK